MPSPHISAESIAEELSTPDRKIVLGKVAAGLSLTYSDGTIAQQMPTLLTKVGEQWALTETGERVASQPIGGAL